MITRRCCDCKHVDRVASGQLRCGDERALWVCDRFEWNDRRHQALEYILVELDIMQTSVEQILKGDKNNERTSLDF